MGNACKKLIIFIEFLYGWKFSKYSTKETSFKSEIRPKYQNYMTCLKCHMTSLVDLSDSNNAVQFGEEKGSKDVEVHSSVVWINVV